MQVVELLYIRAICHHALGYIREAVKDYEDCLAWSKVRECGGGGTGGGSGGMLLEHLYQGDHTQSSHMQVESMHPNTTASRRVCVSSGVGSGGLGWDVNSWNQASRPGG